MFIAIAQTLQVEIGTLVASIETPASTLVHTTYAVYCRVLIRRSDFDVTANSMDELVALCKRRGFIFQSSEIYGGLQGLYDYGPLGVELKNNLKQAWWRAMVYDLSLIHI